MVTSSSTLAAYGAIGAGVPPYEIKQIITVCKAYSSAVGAGAFVSEIFGDEADELRRRGGDGGEFGATTGRPRRVGWFDAVASRYGCRIQGSTEVALTVLDVLGYLDSQITLIVIRNGKVVKKYHPVPPQKLVNVIKCKNPRCITSIETNCDHIFELSPSGRYRCLYCNQEMPVGTKAAGH